MLNRSRIVRLFKMRLRTQVRREFEHKLESPDSSLLAPRRPPRVETNNSRRATRVPQQTQVARLEFVVAPPAARLENNNSRRATRVPTQTRVARLEFVVAKSAAPTWKQQLASGDASSNTNSSRPTRVCCCQIIRPDLETTTGVGRREFQHKLESPDSSWVVAPSAALT